jgi:hypothetical protein
VTEEWKRKGYRKKKNFSKRRKIYVGGEVDQTIALDDIFNNGGVFLLEAYGFRSKNRPLE